MGMQEGEPHNDKNQREWTSPQYTDPTLRVYNVPPERREEAFRLRTAGLQALHEIEKENKPPLNKDWGIEQSKMSVAELADRLKYYPLLLSYVLETMTDTEWEEYLSRIESGGNHSTLFQRTKGLFKKLLPGNR